jgi:hypothetical protein
MQTVLPTSKPILAVPVRPLHERVRFFALAPARLMAETQLGAVAVAVAGYARYLGISALNSSRASRQTGNFLDYRGTVFTISAEGIAPPL